MKSNATSRSTVAGLTAVVVALILGVTATAALAHVKVSATSPSGTAKTSVRSAKVAFTGPIRRGTLKVVGPNGKKVSSGSGGRDPRSIRRLAVSLKGGLKAGRYKASWSMVASDGHRQSGSFRFRLKR